MLLRTCVTRTASARLQRYIASDVGARSKGLDEMPGESVEELLRNLMPSVSHFLARARHPRGVRTHHCSAEELLRRLGPSFPEDGARDLEALRSCVDALLVHSAQTAHPLFLDKLYAATYPVAMVGDLLTSLLNTNVHTYSAAPALSAVEVATVRQLCRVLGYSQEGDGIFCPGGSHCNLTAMLVARHKAFPEVRAQGFGSRRPAVVASAHAHYSISRAAMVLGLGTECVESVPTDERGSMRAADVDAALTRLRAEGREPFFVSATAGTTVLGGFDPLRELSHVCKDHGVWLHVDGAWGGCAVLSDEHRRLLDGVELTNSFAVSFHKMLGMPIQCAALLVNGSPGLLHSSNASNADYLFHAHPDAAFDIGDKTLQCGRRGDALKLWLAWRHYGRRGLAARVDNAVAMARAFNTELHRRAEEGLALGKPAALAPLARNPPFCNVGFFYVPPQARAEVHAAVVLAEAAGGSSRGDESSGHSVDAKRLRALGQGLSAETRRLLDTCTGAVYTELQRRGRLSVNFNPLEDWGVPRFFRLVTNSHLLRKEHMVQVVDEVEAAGDALFGAQA